ncbi:3-oxoacyl-[acyl-carrier protein] reductase [Pseudonocardia sp. Ae168_Ps1]|uniref:SDR family NAD(P)-dependent oxidoreductase n=1 Tax=unclassified Pseudonocardia TaxID=2619320 RepID=UPI0001FFE573|nr:MULTISPECIES: SDR family NAD(P)-dependent oxidoreductase [unclassified Pseudonocardia]ALE73073.1 short-chain dehydrogenase [Pseudonocardia sp. EC080625-04]ALL76389.1 short-chain dehydrogenase [Pseudonocardia sp. EC080610-09]ALL83416.1 short-chain dehydrogenase [Pseudonocardia sp. EC080619-01]OLL72776.1 3-oxoacyl-[acyl-carrier protein] reductase [Pseudonocardia sp. Ae150A_Ps1]OLL78749.1 3-oxoacyl-[acyl-carrier protein] reductase [Pseudonocardia sp. Ae168_Ps1]
MTVEDTLQDRVAIVTGAAQGIGRATALRLAAEGAVVACADIQDCAGTVALAEKEGGRAVAVELDVRRAADWEGAVAGLVAEHGRIDLLANVAGVVNLLSPDTVVGLTEDAWDVVIDTDLKGVWLGMRAVIPAMVDAGGGRIVNIASMAALRGLPNLASYSAAKGGVVGLTQQAAFEYADQGVLVNAIAPGTIDTPILAGITDEMRAANADAHLVRRLGRPDEIAAMVAYLFREGSFQTGITFPVDGGWAAKGNF